MVMTPEKAPVIFLTIANNAEKTIKRCIDSVLGQEYSNLIYYVCDNGSEDSTRRIIEGYATNDTRVVPVCFNDNGWRLIDLVSTILLEHEDGFFAVLDADDEYKPDFLTKMLSFMYENDLDLAACGSDSLDAVTSELISKKELGCDLVLAGRGFLDKFMIYRRYIHDFWGKVYTLPTLRKAYIEYKRSNAASPTIGRNFELFNYMALKSLKRAGVFGESLHKYYVSPSSQSSRFYPGQIEASVSVYHTAKEYLQSFGAVDKITQDYLYAIYLGHLYEVLTRLYKADLPVEEKLYYISQILDLQLTKEMLAHEADPQFINLGKRDEFLSGIDTWRNANKGRGV